MKTLFPFEPRTEQVKKRVLLHATGQGVARNALQKLLKVRIVAGHAFEEFLPDQDRSPARVDSREPVFISRSGRGSVIFPVRESITPFGVFSNQGSAFH